MPTFLVTNDDGAESPMLLPLADALQEIGPVHIVVPDIERSWVAKAMSRFGTVRVRRADAAHSMHVVGGTPADCVNLGLHELFPRPPDVVVSGVNLGLNYGSAFLLSSGTVGAALEAAIAGVPALAFSLAIPRDQYGLAGADRAARLGNRVTIAAGVAADIVGTVLAHGFPPEVDAFSINFPAELTRATAWRMTSIARTRYGSVFSRDNDGHFVHRFKSYHTLQDEPDADVAAVSRGEVSIAPLRLRFDAAVPSRLRAALEKTAGARHSGQS